MRQRGYGSVVKWLAVAGIVAGLGGNAFADSAEGSSTFNIALGLKWQPLRYTAPVGQNTLAGGAESLYGFQTTSLDSYIGFFFHPQIGIIVGLDVGYGSSHQDIQSANPTLNYDTSYFQFGFSLGAKFYLTRPAALKVSPYLYVDIFKYIVAIGASTNEPGKQGPPNDVVGAQAGLHSPTGGSLAFGAEYFFTNSFSLGAEVFGLKMAYVEGDYNNSGATHLTEKDFYFTMYTAITLNYRFLASASVRLEADVDADNNPRPVRKPKARPRPTEDNNDNAPPPPPSPESVD